MAIHGNTWLYMIIHGYTSLYMGIDFFFFKYFLIKAFLTFTYKIEIKKNTHTHTYIVQTNKQTKNTKLNKAITAISYLACKLQ